MFLYLLDSPGHIFLIGALLKYLQNKSNCFSQSLKLINQKRYEESGCPLLLFLLLLPLAATHPPLDHGHEVPDRLVAGDVTGGNNLDRNTIVRLICAVLAPTHPSTLLRVVKDPYRPIFCSYSARLPSMKAIRVIGAITNRVRWENLAEVILTKSLYCCQTMFIHRHLVYI